MQAGQLRSLARLFAPLLQLSVLRDVSPALPNTAARKCLHTRRQRRLLLRRPLALRPAGRLLYSITAPHHLTDSTVLASALEAAGEARHVCLLLLLRERHVLDLRVCEREEQQQTASVGERNKYEK